ncbi:unknown [Prevotella sp. CAG:924]|nr:unknown [Prevotella sp. CAG:924]
MCYLCIAFENNGTLSERLGNGLQNRSKRFDSARYLYKPDDPIRIARLFVLVSLLGRSQSLCFLCRINRRRIFVKWGNKLEWEGLFIFSYNGYFVFCESALVG